MNFVWLSIISRYQLSCWTKVITFNRSLSFANGVWIEIWEFNSSPSPFVAVVTHTLNIVFGNISRGFHSRLWCQKQFKFIQILFSAFLPLAPQSSSNESPKWNRLVSFTIKLYYTIHPLSNFNRYKKSILISFHRHLYPRREEYQNGQRMSSYQHVVAIYNRLRRSFMCWINVAASRDA